MTTATRVKTYVVDADGHVLEPPTALVDYVDPAYKDRAPHIVARDGREYWAGDHWIRFMPGNDRPRPEDPATNVPGLAGVGRWKDAKDTALVEGGLPYSQCNPAGFY